MNPFNRRSLLTGSPAALALGLAPAGLAEARGPIQAVPAGGVQTRNVRDLGADGGGRVEHADRDTAAFERALAEVGPGGIVLVPMGRYVLRRPLVLIDQHLVGHPSGGWNPDAAVAPTLQPLQAEGPALTLRGGSSLHGLAIDDAMIPDDNGTLKQQPDLRFNPRPPAIRIEGQASITNVKISCPFDGIECSDQTENGRTNLENVFIISPGRDGVYFSSTSDVSTLRNVEAWCNLGPSKGAGFRFGQNDQVHGSRLFAYGFEVGFSFNDSPRHRKGSYGSFLDCSSDGCVRGWVVRGKTRLGILGGDFLNHFESLLLRGPEVDVRIQSAYLQSNGAPAIACDEARSLIATGCEVAGAGSTTAAHIRIGAGIVQRATISGCQIVPAAEPQVRPGIEILVGVQQCLVTGNIFARGPGPKIVGNRAPDSEVVVADNLGT